MAQPRKFPQFPLSSPLTGNELVLLWQGLGNRRITLNTLSNFLGGGGAVGSSIYVDVRSFGTVGDGVVDDTDALQTAIDTANGRWIYFHRGDIYKITGTLNLPVGTKIFAYGARVFSESHIYMLDCQGDNIIEGLEIEGAGSTPYNEEGRGINIVGTVNNYKTNIKIEDCYIHDIGFISIWNHFAENVTIRNTRMINQGYGGYIGLSVTNVLIEKCQVKGVFYTVGGASYNIGFSRSSGPTLITDPRSYNCTVQNCLIEDNIYWKGLDAHAGDTINFVNNYITNCRLAVALVAGNMPWTSQNCNVKDNFIIDCSVEAVAVTGVVDGESAKNNTIQGNHILNAGIPGAFSTGAIRLSRTEGTQVLDNIIEECESNGVVLTHNNKNFLVVGNTFRDIFSNTFTPNGIMIDGPSSTGMIASNGFLRRDATLGNQVAVRMIFIDNTIIDDTMKIMIGPNNNDGWLNENVNVGNFIFQTLTTKLPMPFPLGRDYQIWTEDTGPGSTNTRVWFEVPAGGAAYFGKRSGGLAHFMRFEATNIDLLGNINIDPSTGRLISRKTALNITGEANSGNSLHTGLSYSFVEDGLSNNYPSFVGTLFTVKESNARTFQLFADTTSNLWIRSLHTADNNTWQKVVTDAPSDGNFYVRRNGAWEILPQDEPIV